MRSEVGEGLRFGRAVMGAAAVMGVVWTLICMLLAVRWETEVLAGVAAVLGGLTLMCLYHAISLHRKVRFLEKVEERLKDADEE